MMVLVVKKKLFGALPLAIFLILLPVQWLLAQAKHVPHTETIVINANAPSHPFPHRWERMFGSGHAILSLRGSYRRDLVSVKQATNFEYIRFHGIFDREVGLFHLDKKGKPLYNFTNVDQIYDGLLARGVRPYVELSFMPKDLAATPVQQGFFYHPYSSPPRDWNQWGDLIRVFAQHLIERYGIVEVSHWYFEVWNEPNIDFWSGTPKQSTYFHLYDVAARALKSVNPRLRVGGPSTAAIGWISSFINHCARNNIPIDFVSTHIYGNNTPEETFGTHQHIARRDMVSLAVKKVYDEVKASPLPSLPIIFSEYNASWRNKPEITDSAFMGPWLAETISRCNPYVHILAYWDFSDVFEELGVVQKPFYGGYGLIATGHIRKAVVNDFALLHRLGDERLAVASGPVIVTRRTDGSLAIALWNYASPGPGGQITIFRLSFKDLNGSRKAIIWTVDKKHGSPLATWEAMGEPAFPSREQQKILRRAGEMPAPTIKTVPANNPVLSLKIPPHALSLIEISE